MESFDPKKVNEYVTQKKWNGRVIYCDGRGLQLPDPPQGYKRIRDGNGRWTWRDASYHDVLSQQNAKRETKAEAKAREIAEIEAEMDARDPVKRATREAIRHHREIDKTEKLYAANEILHNRSYAPLFEDLEAEEIDADMTAAELSTAVTSTAKAFEKSLKDAGLKVSLSALQKLATIIQQQRALGVTGNFNPTSLNHWTLVWNKLVELPDVFDDSEVVSPAPVAPAPAPVDPLVEMETASPARAKQIALDGMVEFARPLINSFFDFINTSIASGMYVGVSRDTGSLTKAQKDKIIDYCFSKGSFTEQSLDESRRVVLGLLTPDEKLARDIESTTVPLMNNHQARVDLKSRQRAINEGY